MAAQAPRLVKIERITHHEGVNRLRKAYSRLCRFSVGVWRTQSTQAEPGTGMGAKVQHSSGADKHENRERVACSTVRTGVDKPTRRGNDNGEPGCRGGDVCQGRGL